MGGEHAKKGWDIFMGKVENGAGKNFMQLFPHSILLGENNIG